MPDLTVTLDDEVLTEVQAAADAQGETLGQFIETCLKATLAFRKLVTAAHEAECGDTSTCEHSGTNHT